MAYRPVKRSLGRHTPSILLLRLGIAGIRAVSDIGYDTRYHETALTPSSISFLI